MTLSEIATVRGVAAKTWRVRNGTQARLFLGKTWGRCVGVGIFKIGRILYREHSILCGDF
jgi:hypothetical protein